MHRTMTAAVTAVLAVGMLSGCSFGPQADPAAIEAAETYAADLTAWSAELTPAAAAAKTVTWAEYKALGDAGADAPGVGIGDLLDDVPKLEAFEADAVAHTPGYLAAQEIAARVEVIVDELDRLEPDELKALRLLVHKTYYSFADAYYGTLGGPETERVKAGSAALDALFEGETGTSERRRNYSTPLRDASAAFAEERSALLSASIEKLNGMLPDTGHGASIGAFAADWLGQERNFLDDVATKIATWEYASTPYDAFWGNEFAHFVFAVPGDNAAMLRSAFAAQVAALATALEDAPLASSIPSPKPAALGVLPAPGDPYRKLLIDGYAPWGDAAASRDHTMSRLWMLWHIRELEKTPDSTYIPARSLLLEELDRSIPDGAPIDFRPGGGRVLALIDSWTEAFEPDYGDGTVAYMHDELEEIRDFGAAIRDAYPLVPAVAADYDAVLAVIDEANADVGVTADALDKAKTPTVETNDMFFALDDKKKMYANRMYDAVTPSFTLLDDDAQIQELTADAVRATAP